MLGPVLHDLGTVVVVDEGRLEDPTPCSSFTVAELRHHVLGWLRFFADAVDDPDGTGQRIDPTAWTLGPGADPSSIVNDCCTRLVAAIEAGVADRLVAMSAARMKGDGVLGMILGEYIVHGWDLAVATGRPWTVDDEAADSAREFLETMVTPQFRGPDSGFFDREVDVDETAPPLHRLLGFAGRDPGWSAQ